MQSKKIRGYQIRKARGGRGGRDRQRGGDGGGVGSGGSEGARADIEVKNDGRGILGAYPGELSAPGSFGHGGIGMQSHGGRKVAVMNGGGQRNRFDR